MSQPRMKLNTGPAATTSSRCQAGRAPKSMGSGKFSAALATVSASSAPMVSPARWT